MKRKRSLPNNWQVVAGSIGISLVVGLYALVASGLSPALLMGLLFVVGVGGLAFGLDLGGVATAALTAFNRPGFGGTNVARLRVVAVIGGAFACIGAVLIAEHLVAAGG